MSISEPSIMQITVAQAIALHNVFLRVQSYVDPAGGILYDGETDPQLWLSKGYKRATFEEFVLKQVSPAFGDCIMVEWCGMHLGIEKDGYTHS